MVVIISQQQQLGQANMAIIARVTAVIFTFALLGFTGALAQDHGSLKEAQAMAEAAAQHLEKNGEAAFADFNDGNAWHDRDLYVFVFGPDGTCLAHGANAKMVGQNVIDHTDAEGTPFIENIVAVKGSGWVDYKFANPQTGEIAAKRSYVVQIGDNRVGVGAYAE
jgi:cytochrome c